MPSITLFFSLLCLFSNLYHTQSSSISPLSLLLPITKHHSSLQYLTTLSYGTPLVPTNLVLDLGGPFLWLDCTSSSSSSLLTIPHRSIQCLTAKSHDFYTHTWLSNISDQDQQQPCQILPQNTITGTKPIEGTLVKDFISLQMGPTENFIFSCSHSMLLNCLASGARGMIGLGRSRTSFTSQVFDSFAVQRKITLCLSSSSGVVSFGNIIPFESETLRSLTFTPLVTNPSQEYFINVNSIKISGKKVSFNTPSLSLTQLSSIVPYTTMKSSIYANFESVYLKAALSMNITRAHSVSPFGLCFRSQKVGLNVPVIDFVLQSEMVKWSIYGRNSMVRVSDEVMCLGLLDGGENTRNSIVIGGYQLEDVLLQFDFDTSMLGFSSSLLMSHTSCSDFKSSSISAQ
ncbi:hypothetical protein Lal_00044067 [Lupinus albus]|uniref:Putative nepenthesin n=1 Tax=Lupinus albus TaxID=3870 RepID=A0A6A5PCJ1_LUPAL|nr:putative nepenthesin [Lupinus albus]KAF1895417.1 hypothetical protein Lal_00044067 [Lupinus albus]